MPSTHVLNTTVTRRVNTSVEWKKILLGENEELGAGGFESDKGFESELAMSTVDCGCWLKAEGKKGKLEEAERAVFWPVVHSARTPFDVASTVHPRCHQKAPLKAE